MCGIAGIVNRGPLDEDMLRRMQRSLAHRGPDAQGSSVHTCGEWTVGLVHTRLSILDLSPAGRQPMSFAGNSITYNGEVYNYQALRRDLACAGKRFDSATDTEAVLRAYAKWGVRAMSRLRGMFAFGVWDEKNRRLSLGRDPLGIKPLYYFRRGDLLLFASEVRALLATGLVPRRLSRAGLLSFLTAGSVEQPNTIVEDIRSLLPGHCAVVDLSGENLSLHTRPYGDEALVPAAGPKDRAAAVEELRQVLAESVRLHLMSDVPVGVFLSGGLDSSAVVALARLALGHAPRTYSVCFDEAEFSEESHARTVARHVGAEHEEVRLTEGRLLELLPAALRAMDQPTVDGINTFVISAAVKQAGITVALSGLGADELFAGYPSFRRAAKMRLISAVPRGIRSLVAAAGRTALNGSVARGKFWDLLASDATPASAYAISRRLFSVSEVERLSGQYLESSAPEGSPCGDPVNTVSRLELCGYMSNTLLRDSDFMSMAHALELRVPFVDTTVVQYVLGLPGPWKIDGRIPKPLLVEALKGMLPEAVWRRRKMGFTLPFERWLRSALKPELDQTFHSGGSSRLGLNQEVAASIWHDFQERPDAVRWTRPWALYVAQKWCELNEVQA
jgi:asparagine synthase (glutamine-hydrolysing)